jgi:hypothetical protein
MVTTVVLHYVFIKANVNPQHRNSTGYQQLVLMFRNHWRYFEQSALSLHCYTRNTHTTAKEIFEVTVNNTRDNAALCDYRGYERSLNKCLNMVKYSIKYGIKHNV